MAKALPPDDLWVLIQPLLPAHLASPKGGRPRIDDQAVLTGILLVLKTGLGLHGCAALGVAKHALIQHASAAQHTHQHDAAQPAPHQRQRVAGASRKCIPHLAQHFEHVFRAW